MRRVITIIGLALALAFAAVPAAAQTIDPALGVDLRVDYRSLDRFGPWDDRNYQLTLEDLDFLAQNETELRDPIPAFFRVGMRKAWPTLLREGPAQYPRSALNIFRQMYGGYLIDGKLYNSVRRAGDQFVVVLEHGIDYSDFEESNQRSLSGEVRVTNPVGAAESAIKISPVDVNKVIAGTNGPGSGQKMHYSTDGGETWTETTLPQGARAAIRPSTGRPTAARPTPLRWAAAACSVALSISTARTTAGRPGTAWSPTHRATRGARLPPAGVTRSTST